MRSLIQEMAGSQIRASIRPEERLLLAVLESAYWDLQSPDPTRRRVARTYFLDDREAHAFSFEAICEHFSWSANSIRSRLRDWLETHLPQEPWGVPRREYPDSTLSNEEPVG